MKTVHIVYLLVTASALVAGYREHVKAEKAASDLAQAHKLNADVISANQDVNFALAHYKQQAVSLVTEFRALYTEYTNNIQLTKDNCNIVIEIPPRFRIN